MQRIALPFALAAALSAVAACRNTRHADVVVAPHVIATIASDAAAATDGAAANPLAAVDEHIASLQRFIASRPNDWLDRESLSRAYSDRARRSGDYDDYAHAEDALTDAFRIAPAGSGPFLTRALFNYSVHRLDRVEPDVAAAERAILLIGSQFDTIASLRANVAYHSGHYADARTRYAQAIVRSHTVGNVVALAQLAWKTGNFDEAEHLITDAEHIAATTEHDSRAWVAMVYGLMELDRGRWDQAMFHFRDGLSIAPDDRQLQEHQADMFVRQGQDALALPIFEALQRRTGDPEYMNDVAEIHLRRGERALAEPLLAQARVIYERRLARFPEATAGHALEYYLHHDVPAAVPIAEANVRARAGGEAQTLLAQAYLLAGRVSDAQRVVDATLATAWDTSVLHATAALVYQAAGDTARSTAQRTRALAINPHAMEDVAWITPGPHG